MNNLFLLLFLLSLVGLVVGLAKPSLVRVKSRKQVSYIFGGALVLFFILFGVTAPPTTPSGNAPQQVAENNVQQPASPVVASSSIPTAAPVVAQVKSSGGNQQSAAVQSQPAPQQTQQTPPPVPSPTASITANSSANSVTIPYGTSATISWISTNASTCSVSPSGWTGTSGNQSTGNLTSAQTYSLSCSGSGGSASANVTVNVAAKPTPSPITLSGNGQEATQQFTLQQGLSIFTLQNSGQQNFIVDLLDNNGNEVDNLANAIGDYSGSQALNISAAGTYLLNVQSDGPWSITITQPRPTNAQSVSNLSGTGDVATQFFNLASGLHTFMLSNSGSGNFIVDLLDRNGDEVDNLENTIGDFNGSTAVHIDSGGTYLLNVVSGDAKSNGNWTVQVQ